MIDRIPDLSTVAMLREARKRGRHTHGLTPNQRLWLVKEVIRQSVKTPDGWLNSAPLTLNIPGTRCQFRLVAGAGFDSPCEPGYFTAQPNYRRDPSYPEIMYTAAEEFIRRLYRTRPSRERAIEQAIVILTKSG